MRIEIEFTDGADRYPNALMSVDYEGWPDLPEVAEIRDRILQLYGKTDRYVVEVRSTEFEWGASAAETLLLVSLAANVVELVRGIHDVFAWATREKEEPGHHSADVAEAAARWRIATHWDVTAPRLTKVEEAETTDPRGWKFVFVDDRGVKFTATTQSTRSGVPTTSIGADWAAIGGAPSRA